MDRRFSNIIESLKVKIEQKENRTSKINIALGRRQPLFPMNKNDWIADDFLRTRHREETWFGPSTCQPLFSLEIVMWKLVKCFGLFMMPCMALTQN
ncbi:hypothetical protein KIN20_033365 [Parelaphostrongylus tenuis]|uniref:Uncharacterized protein n=1 Tax=Parelaphostrongylus tenuis TaxID=148309 RepID=A0AAD5RA68_PARTN|nr:hypothetical protein KIN20_033365 [Parelaphostrongylus tenuis]